MPARRPRAGPALAPRLFHTRTVYHSTIAARIAQSGRPIQLGARRVNARSEWLMKGFGLEQDPRTRCRRDVLDKRCEAAAPSINQTAAACATTDETAPASIRHSPHATTTTASGMPNCGLIASKPNANPASQGRCRSSASQPAQNAASTTQRHLTVKHETPERREGGRRGDDECPIRQQMRDRFPGAPHDQRVSADRDEDSR